MFYAKVLVTLVAILEKLKNSHRTGEHEHASEFCWAQLKYGIISYARIFFIIFFLFFRGVGVGERGFRQQGGGWRWVCEGFKLTNTLTYMEKSVLWYT
jgi:hypothetical protein